VLPYDMGSKCNTHNKDTLMYVHHVDHTDIITQGYSNTLGEQLRRKRIELGLMQKELADRLGVSRDTIMRMENNYEISIGMKVDIIRRLSLEPEDDYICFLCNDFGAYIMKLRIKFEMTQEEFGRILSVSRKTVRFWEKEYSMPSYENYLNIKGVKKEPKA